MGFTLLCIGIAVAIVGANSGDGSAVLPAGIVMIGRCHYVYHGAHWRLVASRLETPRTKKSGNRIHYYCSTFCGFGTKYQADVQPLQP
ncbi:MAG: hypothetical protein ACRES7_09595 [Gammaproteobacteria bacterium]